MSCFAGLGHYVSVMFAHREGDNVIAIVFWWSESHNVFDCGIIHNVDQQCLACSLVSREV